MKVIVAGSRTFNNYALLKATLDELNEQEDIEIVSGTARGADTMGEQWAKENNKIIHRFKPDWSIGKSAGIKRNIEMAQFSDAAIIFWDGQSVGSKHMIDFAKQRGLKVKVVRYE